LLKVALEVPEVYPIQRLAFIQFRAEFMDLMAAEPAQE
jgi:hypothetical protein